MDKPTTLIEHQVPKVVRDTSPAHYSGRHEYFTAPDGRLWHYTADPFDWGVTLYDCQTGQPLEIAVWIPDDYEW